MVEANSSINTDKKIYHARFLTRILRSSYFTAGVSGRQKANITPLIVETRRYQPIFSQDRSHCYENIPDWELLHSIVGLYDSYLPEVTPEVIYSNIVTPYTFTVVFIRDVQDVLRDRDCVQDQTKGDDLKTCKTNLHGENDHKLAKEHGENVDVKNDYPEEDNKNLEDGIALTDKKLDKEIKNDEKGDNNSDEEEEEEKRLFDGVFSDEESEEESESSEEDSGEEEYYQNSLDEFLKNVEKRKELAKHDPKSENSIGPEHRIVGAATYKLIKDNDDGLRKAREKVIQLTLLAVRKRFRKLGIGRQILNFVKNPIIVGEYDAIVTFADPGATGFFLRNGFSNDMILNHRFSDLVDNWDNSTLMSYLPPYSECLSSGVSMLREMRNSLSDDLKKWRTSTLESYQAQLSVLERMKHEVMLLRNTVATQETTIASLTAEIDRLRLNKGICEREFKEYRTQVRSMLSQLKNGDNTAISDIDITTLLSSKDSLIIRDENSDSNITKIGNEEFVSLEDQFKVHTCHDLGLNSLQLVSAEKQKKDALKAAKHLFDIRCGALREPSIRMRLFYCGGKAGTLHRIIREGFKTSDLVEGEYGVGLYFTGNPGKAMQYSEPGLILQCDVGIGLAESVLKTDPTRNRPPGGFDSILTGSRSYDTVGLYSQKRHQDLQYLVFDIKQAMPLYLIYYNV